MNLDILEQFTQHLRNTLSRSIDLAWELRQERITPLYLLFALAEQNGSIAAELLRSHGIDPELINSAIPLSGIGDAQQVDGVTASAIKGSNDSKTSKKTSSTAADAVFLWPEFTDDTKRIIERGTIIAMDQQHQYIGTEHVLLALLERIDNEVAILFDEVGLSTDALQQQLLQTLQGNTKLTTVQSMFTQQQPQTDMATQTERLNDEDETPALDFFGTDLTSEEQQRRIDKVIGRNDEIERLIHILSRRTKNNPVLIGEAGVGKTAIVEGLAKRIVEGQVPDMLLGKRIVSLDLSSVLAGTMYRGEFESRLRQLIEELKQHSDVILFIDELHTIVGAGGVQGGTLDAANLLKPSLARGELRCIGATTEEEYRQFIEADAALDRRFQSIRVAEPSPAEAKAIIQGLRTYYEEFHYVTIPDDVIYAAVTLSVRYMPDRRLPDKAIDVIDEAGAKAHVAREVPPALKKLDAAKRDLQKVRSQKMTAVREERFEDAVRLKEKERELHRRTEAARKRVKSDDIPHTLLTLDDVAQVVASSTGIPRDHIIATGQERYSHLSSTLRSAIVGQDDAVKTVLSVLKRSSVGIQSPDRPLGSFLFLGPSGVGKTETARVLAEALSGNRADIIRLDMSEYSEPYTVSKFVGSPAGYVGYKDSVPLVEQIRRTPHAVVLFDEIEKAHPDIYNLLLQILDEGRLTDATGRELDFRQSVIIMTSNIGLDLLQQQAALGFAHEKPTKKELSFEQIQSIINDELRETFPVEFLNRIDHTIVFEPLREKDVKQIVTREFRSVQERLKPQGIRISMMPSVRTFLAQKSYRPEQGARLIRKTMADLIEDQLADTLLAGSTKKGDSLVVGIDKNNKITITPNT